MSEDTAPALAGRQLLRRLGQFVEETRDVAEHVCDLPGLGVRTGDFQRGLAGVTGALGDAVSSTGRLVMASRFLPGSARRTNRLHQL
jgi:hypothetical protein